VLCAVLVAPMLLRRGQRGSHRLGRWIAQARAAMARVRSGLTVYRRPRLGAIALFAQLGAWAVQCLSCYVLFVALDLDRWHTNFGTAAAILFAVNVTAVLPLTPSNLGVFQAACVAVLSYAYGVPPALALGYGIILQAVEVATAVVMGAPALVKEGLSWREVRLRALHTSPVSLSPPPRGAAREAEA
jgi:phosphatidyl-myo-inositol alpha-mannosyltransferase